MNTFLCYKLNHFFYLKFKSLDKSTSDIERLILEFLPAIGIKFLNFFFPMICFRLSKYEKYNVQQSFTFYLIRTGFVRLGSFIFLFISITINIYGNKGFCSSQENTILSETIFSPNSSSKASNQIKVSLEFYFISYKLYNHSL